MLNIKNVKELYNNLQLLKYQCPPPLKLLIDSILTKTFLEYISSVLQCYLPANTID